MKFLVINGSPRREKSITLKIADAFLDGMKEEDARQNDGIASTDRLEVLPRISVCDARIEPCRADFSCWFRTPGQCVIRDDVRKIYEQIRNADAVLWSMPLYVFGFPAPVKGLLDRILPWVKPEITPDSAGFASHPGLGKAGKKHILVMRGALPGITENFGPAVSEFRRIFDRDSICITCAESSLLIYRKFEEIRKLADDYLSRVREAGAEYRRTGGISRESLSKLNALMMPKEEYIRFTNSRC